MPRTATQGWNLGGAIQVERKKKTTEHITAATFLVILGASEHPGARIMANGLSLRHPAQDRP